MDLLVVSLLVSVVLMISLWLLVVGYCFYVSIYLSERMEEAI